MKKYLSLVMIGLSLMLSGCNKDDNNDPNTPPTGDTGKVRYEATVSDPENMKLKTIMRQIRNRSSSLRIQENRKEEKRLRKKKNKKTVADTGYKKVDRKEKKKKEKQKLYP